MTQPLISRTSINIYSCFPSIANFPLYDTPDPAVAFLVRLFGVGVHQENLVRLALWSMRSHILNADIQQFKPTIIFHIEDALYKNTCSLFDQAHIPKENIIIFPSDLIPTNIRGNILPNAAAPFIDPQLERFEHIIVIDADTFSLSRSTLQPLNIMDISLNQLPQDEIIPLRSWVKWSPPEDEYRFWYDNLHMESGGKEKWIELAAQYCDATPDAIHNLMYPEDPENTYRPMHNGAYINIPMAILKAQPEFREFIREVSGTMGHEEIALAVWAMKHYLETGHHIPTFGLQDYIFKDTPPFWIHWDLDDAWLAFDERNQTSIVHLYGFNRITEYIWDCASAIGANENEAGQLHYNVQREIDLLTATSNRHTDTAAPAPPNEYPEDHFPFLLDPLDLRSSSKISHLADDVINICNATAKGNRGTHDPQFVVQHSHAELVALYELASGIHDPPEHNNATGTILQCGLFCGGSALMLAHAAKHQNQPRPVIAIDSYTKDYKPMRDLFDDAYHEHRDNIWEMRMHEHLIPVIADTALYLSHYWNSMIKLAFIDASHHYEPTLKELKLIYPFLGYNSWLVLHDYFNPQTPGVKQALDEHLTEINLEQLTFYRIDQLLIVQCRKSGHDEPADSAPRVPKDNLPAPGGKRKGHHPRQRKLPHRIYK